MWEYVLKRLLWFIPTLFLVSLLGFALLTAAPGDPLDQLVPALSSRDTHTQQAQRQYWTRQLGLDLPLFYFSVRTWAEPDTLYRLRDARQLAAYRQLLKLSGNAQTVSRYFNTVHAGQSALTKHLQQIAANRSLADARRAQLLASAQQLASPLTELAYSGDTVEIKQQLKALSHHRAGVPLTQAIHKALKDLLTQTSPYKNYIPALSWYGSHNRYHRWLFGSGNNGGVIRGDFGISYRHKQPVMAVVSGRMAWSLGFSVLSIVLAYLVSLPLGVWLAQHPGARLSRLVRAGLLLLYALPVFFVGVLLLMLFANPEVLPLFPPSGVAPIGGHEPGSGLLQSIRDTLPYLVLPLLCYTYAAAAYLARFTEAAIQAQLPFPYIRTARAKGLDERGVIRRHALRNSLLPLITVFSSLFPAMIGGSVIIESMFTIPGMGLETVGAIVAKDYPVVIAIITLCALFTMLSYLLADLLYAWADPRIRYRA